jgi:dipeptidyl aminopeptidase/acylaminoacyl peptidase
MSENIEKRPVEIDDLFRLKFITEAQLSPDGKQVIYGVSHVDTEEMEEYAALWMLSLDTNEIRQLTSGKAKDYNASWSPDGKQVAFLSTREETPQIYLIRVDGGEARKLTAMKGTITEGPVWSPDGKHLAFAGSKDHDPPDPGKPYRVTRNVYRFDGVGYLDQCVQDIYTISISEGKPRNLSNDDLHNSNPKWSPDVQEILFLACLPAYTYKLNTMLKSVNMDGKVFEISNDTWENLSDACWTPDGKKIIFIGRQDSVPPGSKTDLWIINRRGGVPECRTPSLDIQIAGGLQPDMPTRPAYRTYITADCQKAYISVQERGAIPIYEIALKGEEACKPVVSNSRSNALLGCDGTKLLYFVSTWHDPTNLYLADMDGKNERQLTDLNRELIAKLDLPSVETLQYKSVDDTQVEGWIMKPPSGEPPYPTLLSIHGGPNGAFGDIYSFDHQMLAGAGYAVLFINPRGSTGYGSEFGARLNLDWGGVDYQDLMTGVDYAVESGISDPQRLGVYGLSYGGYMTCWIVTQTDRFKAGVSENPVTDLYSDYGTGDISAWTDIESFGGRPHEVPENYRKISPITFAHRCTTPTLMLQGEKDFRCPAGQTEQFYTHLKANGCIVEMVRFPESSHIGSIAGKPIIRQTQNEELLNWMNKYVLGVTSEE